MQTQLLENFLSFSSIFQMAQWRHMGIYSHGQVTACQPHTAAPQPSTGLHGVCGQESIQGAPTGKHPPEDPTALKIHHSLQLCMHQLRYFKRTAFFTLSCKDERHFTSSREGEGWEVDLQSQQASLCSKKIVSWLLAACHSWFEH